MSNKQTQIEKERDHYRSQHTKLARENEALKNELIDLKRQSEQDRQEIEQLRRERQIWLQKFSNIQREMQGVPTSPGHEHITNSNSNSNSNSNILNAISSKAGGSSHSSSSLPTASSSSNANRDHHTKSSGSGFDAMRQKPTPQLVLPLPVSLIKAFYIEDSDFLALNTTFFAKTSSGYDEFKMSIDRNFIVDVALYLYSKDPNIKFICDSRDLSKFLKSADCTSNKESKDSNISYVPANIQSKNIASPPTSAEPKLFSVAKDTASFAADPKRIDNLDNNLIKNNESEIERNVNSLKKKALQESAGLELVSDAGSLVSTKMGGGSSSSFISDGVVHRAAPDLDTSRRSYSADSSPTDSMEDSISPSAPALNFSMAKATAPSGPVFGGAGPSASMTSSTMSDSSSYVMVESPLSSSDMYSAKESSSNVARESGDVNNNLNLHGYDSAISSGGDSNVSFRFDSNISTLPSISLSSSSSHSIDVDIHARDALENEMKNSETNSAANISCDDNSSCDSSSGGGLYSHRPLVDSNNGAKCAGSDESESCGDIYLDEKQTFREVQSAEHSDIIVEKNSQSSVETTGMIKEEGEAKEDKDVEEPWKHELDNIFDGFSIRESDRKTLAPSVIEVLVKGLGKTIVISKDDPNFLQIISDRVEQVAADLVDILG